MFDDKLAEDTLNLFWFNFSLILLAFFVGILFFIGFLIIRNKTKEHNK